MRLYSCVYHKIVNSSNNMIVTVYLSSRWGICTIFARKMTQTVM